MSLREEIDRVAEAALARADAGETLAAVIPAEPGGRRTYLCAYEADAARRWLVLDEDGQPVPSRALVRETVSIAVLCEVAADSAGGGDLSELRRQLALLRMTENPPGLDAADAAALALERAVGDEPRLATPAYLDEVGEAARQLEAALGETGGSPFAETLRAAVGAVDLLAAEVEENYKHPLA